MFRSVPAGLRFATAFVAVFALTQSAFAQTLTTLAEFDGSNGSYPYGGLIQATNGYFYGTAFSGGASGYGTVFKIATNGTLTTVLDFDYSIGGYPRSALIQGTDGNLYGTTSAGGEGGYGTVFKLSLEGDLTTLVTFDSTNGDGPSAGLVEGADHNFYGTTFFGGAYDLGTVFKMTPAGVLTTLKHFTTGSGKWPSAPLVFGTNGLLHGTTQGGGTYDDGTVFQIATDGTLYKQMASFFSDTKGSSPEGPLLRHSDGNFYGTAPSGGNVTVGTAFKVTPAGLLTTVYSFNGVNGENPRAGLTQADDGNFYGLASAGGSAGAGTLFKLTPAGGITRLVSFGGTNGSKPYATMIRGNDGWLYGTTVTGGASNKGTIFRFNVTPLSPVITSQPQSRSNLVSTSVLFSVAAASTIPLNYQWQKNESNLWGATNSSLSLSNLAMADSGTYRVLVSNSSGSVTSSNATLAVYLPPAPASPTGLSATALSSSSISLRWTNNATNVTGFILWRGTSSNSTTVEVGTVTGTARGFTNSGLAQATTYFYSVQATNLGGLSEKSPVASAQTLQAVPATPGGLSATTLSSTAILLRWTSTATNVSSYVVWRGPASNLITTKLAILPGTARSFTNAGISSGTTFYYSLQASNSIGLSGKSPYVSARTYPAPPPAPTGLGATALSSSAISLHWTNKNTNVTGFIVWRGSASSMTTQLVATVSPTTLAFTNSKLAADTVYYYSVQATNVGGPSPKSIAVNAKTLLVPPSAPTALSAAALSPNRVSVSWKNTATNAAGFTISRSMTLTGPFSVVTNVSATASNCIESTVHSGLTYIYTVNAYNSGGSSTNSLRASVSLPVGLNDNLVWQNTNGQFVIWVMNQTNFVRYAYVTNGPAAKTGWRVVAFPDLNNDFNADVLWQNSNGQLMTWLMRNTNLLRSASLVSGPTLAEGWKIVSAPDLTRDGKADFLWARTSGATMLWQMNGTNLVKQVFLRAGQATTTGWGIAGTTDLDGNLHTDIIWSNTNGMNAVWWMNKTNYITNAALRTFPSAAGWKLSGLLDLSADQKADFVWEKNDGRMEGWLMNGSNYLRSVTLRTNAAALTGWRLVGPK